MAKLIGRSPRRQLHQPIGGAYECRRADDLRDIHTRRPLAANDDDRENRPETMLSGKGRQATLDVPPDYGRQRRPAQKTCPGRGPCSDSGRWPRALGHALSVSRSDPSATRCATCDTLRSISWSRPFTSAVDTLTIMDGSG